MSRHERFPCDDRPTISHYRILDEKDRGLRYPTSVRRLSCETEVGWNGIPARNLRAAFRFRIQLLLHLSGGRRKWPLWRAFLSLLRESSWFVGLQAVVL